MKLELYTDYVSNPKSDKWNNGQYPVIAAYTYTNDSTGESHVTIIKVKSQWYARDLIEFWNACKDGGTYTLDFPLFDRQHNLHCESCRSLGGNTPRYILRYTWVNSTHFHYHMFPCLESLQQFKDPFVKLGAIVTWKRIDSNEWHV